MEKQFNLIYYHRTTGVAYRVRRASAHDFIMEDPETLECIRISKHKLDKNWRADKDNGKRQKKYNFNFAKVTTG